MKIPVLLTLLLLVAGALANVAAVENKGAEKMVIEGGSRGRVPFPHWRHQAAAQDCAACHESFPRQTGSIRRLKSEGRLAGKQVMNKLCISCHRAEKRAGKPTGPVTCSDCHVKE